MYLSVILPQAFAVLPAKVQEGRLCSAIILIVSDSAETRYIAPLIRGVQVDYLIPLPSGSNPQRMARETKLIGYCSND